MGGLLWSMPSSSSKDHISYMINLRMCAVTVRWCVVAQIHSQKKRTGVIAPKRFVQRLKKDNELFRSYMHQVKVSQTCCLSSTSRPK